MLTAALLVGITATACGLRKPWQDTEDLPPEQRHRIESERLEEAMRGLERLTRERLPTGMDERGERQRRADEVARLAGLVASSAGQMRRPDGRGLSPQERVEVERIGEQLATRAEALREEAAYLPPTEVTSRVQVLRESCDECHASLGVVPVEREGDP